MIPLQLTLKNFLSYRETTLDFRGLHTACICGANGSGKSSLLEAITWAIWGKSRVASEDDVIYLGQKSVRVDFLFINNEQTYRIIRTRQRGAGSRLDFQVQQEQTFRTLTGKGLRGTQQLVIAYLKLDYDTFINSAYLRQGRADEFMLRRPRERKQILADLLKLEQYEVLANQAKDFSKQFQGQAEQLKLSLASLEQQLTQGKSLVADQGSLTAQLEALQEAQRQDQEQLQQLQTLENQRQTWQQQLSWQQTQYQGVIKECDRLLQEQTQINTQLETLETHLSQAGEIETGYRHFLELQQAEVTLSQTFQAYQDAQQQRQQLEQQLLRKTNELQLQIRSDQSRLDSLAQQAQEIEETLSQADKVQAGLKQLQVHRQRLSQLDQLQSQVAPLLQRRQDLQTEIERAEARLNAKLEQLQTSAQHLSEQMAQVPQMRQSALAVHAEITALDKKRVYQQRVHEKGAERRGFQERLQENQRNCQRQLEELRQKLQLLEIPNATCPLCEQTLEGEHRHFVVEKTQREHQDIQEQFWMIREQLTVCERELQILRREYSQLTEELSTYDSLQQRLGNLEAQLEATGELHVQLQQIQRETEQLEQSLALGNYAQALQSEFKQLEQTLGELNYDEQTHALVRGEVERWRWAEIKQAKIEEATRRQANINRQKPKLLEKIASLKHQARALGEDSEIQRQIEQIDQQIHQLGYERSHHQTVSTQLRQAQSWQLRYQQLQEAQQQLPQVQERLHHLSQQLQVRQEDQQAMEQQVATLSDQLQQAQDPRSTIHQLEQQIQQRRQQLDQSLAQQGHLQATLTQLTQLQAQYDGTETQLQGVRQQARVYQELAQAFGKNGIQALMIENILPQLEAQTNHILARLTGNQFHVQFVTQKSSRSRRSKSESSKLIETLEILIADAKGTRPYETYSGGEAFRINFSIRLALAQILAQRSGTALQMLIIDEGFGTQDREGCDRLIAAINAIAADFACILTVTHMPQFKEAFEHRIEVSKTNQGSQLRLLT